MSSQLHHVAVNSASFEQTVRFFQEVFDMEISRTRGNAPARQLWFQQGIQINEVPQVHAAASVWDHVGIAVTNKEEVLRKVPSWGCEIFPDKPHWFSTPYGIVIELM